MATVLQFERPSDTPVPVIATGVKLWWSALEIAEAKLPGVPRDKRKVNDLARTSGWAFRIDAAGQPLARTRTGRGGGLEYHIDVLPASARAALVKSGAECTNPSPCGSAAAPFPQGERGIWTWFDSQSDSVKAKAKARLAAVDAIARYEQRGMTRSAAVALVSGEQRVSPATLWTWLGLIKGIAATDHLAHLSPRFQGGGKEAAVDQGAWNWLISFYLRDAQPSWSHSCRQVRRNYCAERGLDLPDDRTLWRKFEREVDPLVAIKRRKGREAHERTMPPQIRTVAGLHALELVNIDGHTFDLFVEWPGLDKPIRPTLVGIQDVYSRKLLAWRIDDSENSVVTRLAFADLFRDHGIPNGCLLDNGRAFASKKITGGAKTRYRFKIKPEDATGLLPSLNINPTWATPYHGQAKPIERFFKEFAQEFVRNPEFQGAWTGNSPANKPESYGKSAVPYDLFMKALDGWIAEANARTGRRTEMAAGKQSFDQVYSDSYMKAAQTGAITRATPEQLRIALLTAEDSVKLHREHGSITIHGNRYWNDDLSMIAGQRVLVRFDPDNLHSEVYVYALTGEFITTAPIFQASGFKDAGAARTVAKARVDWRKRTKEAETALDLYTAAELAAFATEPTQAEPAPDTNVVRMAQTHNRAGGRTGGSSAALAALHTPAETDARKAAAAHREDVIDRLARVHLLRLVDSD